MNGSPTGSPRMRRRLAGLHEGPDLRAERRPEGWAAEARLRDVGAPIGAATGLYEYDAEGDFVPMGTFRTMRLAGVALDLVRAGSHIVQLAHRRSEGDGVREVPTRVVRYAEARDVLVAHGLADPLPEEDAPLSHR